MAIVGYNNYDSMDGNYFASEGMVAQPGVGLVLNDPSGLATGKPGDANNKIQVATGASGEVFIGVLFDEVMDWDRTQSEFRFELYRAATTPCRPVNLIREGDICVDTLASGITPQAGDDLYLTTSGEWTNVATGLGVVGEFRGAKDANGYVNIRIDK